MQTKHSPLRRVLLASLTAMPLAMVPGAAPHAAEAIPSARDHQAGAFQVREAATPAWSLTGSLLGSIVSVQRNNIPDAAQALFGAVMHGYREPDFMLMALRYNAMDAGEEAAGHALTLARLLPKESLSRIVMGTAAFRNRQWKDAAAYFSLHSKTSQGFLRLAGQGLLDWCQYGASPTHDDAGRLAQSTASLDPVAYLALLQQARIASLRNQARTDGLFARLDASAGSMPPLLRVQTMQFEADWLAFRHHRDAALKRLQQVGGVLPAFQLVADRLRPQELGTGFDPSQGLAEFYVGITTFLGDTNNRDRNEEGTASPADQGDQNDDKLKDIRQLKILLLRQAFLLRPDLTLAKILLAEELRNDGQADLAQTALDHVADDDPLAPLSDHAQAQIALKRHDLKAALRALERVARANPDNPDILNELGATQDQLGAYQAAADTYTRALNHVSVMEARVWPLLLGRAMAWDHMGRRDKAQADLDRALALAPSEPMLLNYAGYSDVLHGERPEQALRLLRHAMDLAPDDAEIRDSYAWALLKQNGDLAQALPLLLSAVNAAPGDAEIAYHLGVAYWYQGRQLEARDQWSQALNNKPEPETKALIEAALANGPDLPVLRGRPIPPSR
ncbi:MULTISPECIES: tetratricopeptide repeat protein [Asaia]|uniref:tetratricopeptide repeat protein n=1 Tax=Asaia TaxID=91914 RepID=UPI002552C97B|nr:tetratricopeptide repeat protein [Asaia sp. HumB]MDL2171267.1 tetratricopeptide repeat protein [Asaia sp. HumB]